MNNDQIDMGEESEPSPISLEDKYRQQMRQIYPQKIELPISTLPDMIERQIDLSPDFQRRNIWTRNKQSRFVESIIMNVPIPPVFLGEDDYGKYVVLDGRQRLTAISSFLENTYALEGLAVWDELNGLTYHDLKKKGLDKTILRRFIPAVLILKESSPEVKYDVFDRLNTGGMEAEPMEIRNAIYRGQFCTLLHKLSANATFRKLWDIPEDPDERQKNSTYSRMEDLELVLRFFALEKYQAMKGRFRDYLSTQMDERNRAYKQNANLAALDQRRFEQAVENAFKVFGLDAFRKPGEPGAKRGVKSAPLADAVMFALADVDPAQLTPPVALKLASALQGLFSGDPEFKKAIGTGTNGKGATQYRLEKTREVVRACLAT
ncbi:DUF262 domain-containing protein [Pyxidicoccus fallax]|uniref:DUF262 domain-containing protein n=1 Tax=Pyxidicoccus fallax TaxID=394095 RepID=A0A848LAP2_9BACT|nr:DUF262 domain-containing protein [Pyxidicoccus fallax]NMO15969.1 DUF262 domain-containing protein [Pyxidicoccus fallax]NPC79951.1 DUF262 domain-containing protein [Pyxidicoccus fallax]